MGTRDQPDEVPAKTLPSKGFSRRRFLVMMGGAALGAFALPALDEPAREIEKAPPNDSHTPDNKLQQRTLITLPTRMEVDHGTRTSISFLWTELTPEGSTRVLTWQVETEEELAEATRFYDAARKFNSNAAAKKAEEGFFARLLRPFQRSPKTRGRTREEELLLQAIRDDLEADAPRLAYAQWLKKNGDKNLAEFIYLDVLLDPLPNTHELHQKYGERWWQLQEKYGRRWFAPILELGLSPHYMGEFMAFLWLTRGFIEEFEIPKPGILPDHADTLFDNAPILHDLTIDYHDHCVSAIVESPRMNQIRSLNLRNVTIDQAGLEIIMNSPNLECLESITLDKQQFDEHGAMILTRSRRLTQLKSLDLPFARIYREGMEVLADTDRWSQLESLSLRFCEMSEHGRRVYSNVWEEPSDEYPNGRWITTLNEDAQQRRWEQISHNGQLLASFKIKKLKSLNLDSTDVDDPIIVAMIESGRLNSIIELNLNSCRIGDPTVRALIQSGIARQLESLQLSHNPGIGAKSLADLAASLGPVLKVLDITQTNADDSVMYQLCRNHHPTKLAKLKIGDTAITAQGMVSLAKSPSINNLNELDLRGSNIGPKGAELISLAPNFQSLTEIRYRLEDVTNEGHKHLQKSFPEDVLPSF